MGTGERGRIMDKCYNSSKGTASSMRRCKRRQRRQDGLWGRVRGSALVGKVAEVGLVKVSFDISIFRFCFGLNCIQ